ncbi:MAG: Asp-tRNA(Asn)/Glu-tRNA(Gln) amidotransferase subunit GatC [Firmicutes bacterium]|nr:Asp-tRNA(Asn)/Glu-tRNA(Gln) amidotransferase subunit GatC [Bacillota bacterium]
MAVTHDELVKLAKVSGLEFSDKEYTELIQAFKQKTELMEAMNAVDTSGIELRYEPINAEKDLREDVVRPSLPRDTALSGAAEKDSSAFLVPATVE